MTCVKTEILFVALLAAFACAGCRSRVSEYQTADRIAHCLINEKSGSVPEGLPANFSLVPSPESRLAVDGCLACPSLPQNLVELYAYQLPLRRSSLQFEDDGDGDDSDEEDQFVGTPIPLEAWRAIPQSCLTRMFDFESIRDEAKFTGKSFDAESLLKGSESEAPKLSLRDIVDLALLNSREYQTQKESLYLVALQLGQERFAFTTKFSAGQNGANLDLGNFRTGGQTVERLGLPSNLQIDRALITGGDLLARFANSILLTFDGPTGFTSDVSSSVLIELVQPLIQTDIQFESLTQAERNLVYAARDFARFRKGFFVDFASDYYSLIASFRQIEIDSQNYFSLVRAFNQAEAEYTAGLVPRFQVDQVEQSLLNGRGRLIGTCNSVEQALDQLKLASGLPTETPINLDLSELNELTRLDQLSVSADSTSRVLKRLTAAIKNPDRAELASSAAVLLDRLIDSIELTAETTGQTKSLRKFELERAQFLLDYARLNAGRILFDLQKEIRSESPSAPVIFQRTVAYCNALKSLANRQLEFAELDLGESGNKKVEKYRAELEKRAALVDQLGDKLQDLIQQEQIEKLPALILDSDDIRKQLYELVIELDEEFEIEVSENADEDLARIKSNVDQLISEAKQVLDAPGLGLKPIDIEMDDAMITAIVLRYDLMNQRGELADDWRQIKLAADELKSVLTLRAAQRIETEPGSNQPFNFDLDNSSTTLGLSFDAPLNRFSQRNSFRAALIGYQRSVRNLKLLEDNVKFSIRNDLRNLTLDREQYLIAVASAALAYERVVSTSLEFRLGTGGVSARDFLEAQTAYTDALSDVASRHIRYLVDRTQLFFDLELLMVDEDGFWNDVRDEEVQPEPQFSIPAWGTPVFGELPNVRYSSTVRQILCPVSSESTIYDEAISAEPQQNFTEDSTLGQETVNLETVDAPVPEETP
jgi:outer membrane protein TolC